LTSTHEPRAALDAMLTDSSTTRRVRRDVEALMLRILVDHHPNAVVDEHAGHNIAGFRDGTVRRPVGLAGVAVALLVERTAHGLAQEHAARARADGNTWEEIGVAAGLEPTAEPAERAAAAFTLAAGTPARWWDAQVVSWRCGGCGQRIRDTGPDAGRGEDETGHTPTCERRLAQLAAWEARDAAADLDDQDEHLDDDGDSFPDGDWNPDAPQGFR
jgi:hypothetical protein